jgi:hypothetical protein
MAAKKRKEVFGRNKRAIYVKQREEEMKHLSFCIGLILTLGFATGGHAGNGAPNGPHYNLNIIGVPKEKTALMKDDGLTGQYGRAIFVKEDGTSKIMLSQGTDFQVLDKNGTDPDGAAFQLPAPDPDGDGTTQYSVFARALGKPTGSAKVTTCGVDPSGALECSIISLTLDASTKRPAKFTNVSKYLLYIYADVDEDTVVDRVPLFAKDWTGFFWEYDNNGLKLAQLRFYQCATTVPGTVVGDLDGDTVPNTEADFRLAEQLGLLTSDSNCF